MTITELHKRHGAYLLECLDKYGVKNEQDREDLRQDIYRLLIESNRAIHDDNVKGILSKIARDKAIDYQRKKRRDLVPTDKVVLHDQPIPMRPRFTSIQRPGAEEGCPYSDTDGQPTPMEDTREIGERAVKKWQDDMEGMGIEKEALLDRLLDDYAPNFMCAPKVPAIILVNLVYEGYSHAEIARKLKVSQRTVKRWWAAFCKYAKEQEARRGGMPFD